MIGGGVGEGPGRALQLQVKAHCLALPQVSVNLVYWGGN